MKKIYLIVGVLFLGLGQLFAQQEFNTGKIEVVINSYGRIRFYSPPPAEDKQLERASILVGISEDFVFDFGEDADYPEPAVLVENPQYSDYEINAFIDNGYSGKRPDVLVRLSAYGWEGKSFIILKYTVENKEATTMNAVVGMEIIPAFDDEYGGENALFDETNKFARFYGNSDYTIGLKALSSEFTSLAFFDYVSGYANDNSFWNWMTSNVIDAPYAAQSDDGIVAVTGQPVVAIDPSGTVDVYFAMALCLDEAELISAMAEAKVKYDDITGNVAVNNLEPGKLWLGNNYPNPFNDGTMISYSLPTSGYVSLKVYDQLGREVAAPVQGVKTAGVHKQDFNPGNLSAGLYFYTLTFNGSTITQKMIITD